MAFAETFKALSDPARRQILELLKEGPMSAGEIGTHFEMTGATMSYHLKILKKADLVFESRDKNFIYYQLNASVLEEILPYIDAMNIDLKGFTDRYYRDVLGGDRGMVMRFIERAVKSCHVELTTLIIPGENDSEEEMREMCSWIAGLETGNARGAQGVHGNRSAESGREIPLHISRFFPRFHMTDRGPTDVRKVYRLAEVAGETLKYVYTGNC